jgi:hypothetical protein
MDAQQGRADGATALVARGAKPATVIEPPPVLPVIKAVIATEQAEVEPLQPEELTRAVKAGGCEAELVREQVPLRGIDLLSALPASSGSQLFLPLPRLPPFFFRLATITRRDD